MSNLIGQMVIKGFETENTDTEEDLMELYGDEESDEATYEEDLRMRQEEYQLIVDEFK